VKIRIFIPLLALTLSVFAQQYQFKTFDIEQGICHRFIYTIQQSNNGLLWLGTGDGVCIFTGKTFINKWQGDSIANSFINTSFKDKKGNLWFGQNDGSVSKFDGQYLKKITQSEMSGSQINSICEDEDGTIYCATQTNGILVIKPNGKIDVLMHQLSDIMIYTIFSLNKNELLVGSSNGLFRYNINDKSKKNGAIQGFDAIQVQNILKLANGKIIIATAGNGLYEFNPSNSIASGYLEIFELQSLMIQQILEDSYGNLWLATFGNGVYKINYDGKIFSSIQSFDETNGISSNYIRSVYEDKEGNIWFGSYGNGLFMLGNQSFQRIEYPEINNNITSIVFAEDFIYYGGTSGIIEVQKISGNKRFISVPSTENVISMAYDFKNQYLFYCIDLNGLYQYDIKNNNHKKIFSTQNSIENSIQRIMITEEAIYLATKGGIITLEPNSFKPIEHFTTLNGLPHNNITDILKTKSNGIYIATKSNGLQSINSDKHLSIQGSAELQFSSLAEDENENMWSATYGTGVFAFLKDSIVNFSSYNGLKSDYCYSITYLNKGIYVGHRLGISMIKENGIIKTFGTEVGFRGDCNLNSIATDKKGSIYWGTNNGLIIYNTINDQKASSSPPVSITKISLNDSIYEVSESIYLDYGIYKLRVDVAGISFSNPDGITYQYMLEGFDLDWTEPTKENAIKYSRLEEGNYTLLVKAINSDGVSSEIPAKLTIIIAKPYWKTWWFYLLTIAAIIGTFFFIVKYRDAKQKAFQRHLEKLLDERTHEVILQKEEIELKNKDITSSINYAWRIQSSMLPSETQLKQHFQDSFILYKPRDIVSGDFYWYSKLSDDKIILVCSDCTGHGVPGSLVSMIGLTLLKDIINKHPEKTPSEYLHALDHDFQHTINQNTDSRFNQDGMDITIAEYNPKKQRLIFSSAMRPILAVKDGSIIIIRGDKFPIGGYVPTADEAKKVFSDQEIHFKSGDSFYLMSDGYADQFGGESNEKFKLYRLKQLLQQISHQNMKKQFEALTSTFELWRGNFRQIDDVLIIGIRV